MAEAKTTVLTIREWPVDLHRQMRSEAAIKEVQSWRRAGKLPFPRLAPNKMDELEGSLDYPPRGSVDIDRSEQEIPEAVEPLSTEPDIEDADESKRPSDGGNR